MGSEGKIRLLNSDSTYIDINFNDLKNRFDNIVSAFFRKEKNNIPSVIETHYLSEKKDENQNRVWAEFNLDIASEGEEHLFQTNEMWNAQIQNFDSSVIDLPATVKNTDSIKQALEKIEAQLDVQGVDVTVTTPMIEAQSIDPMVHLKTQ